MFNKAGPGWDFIKNHWFGLAVVFGAGSRVAAAGGVCGAMPVPGERSRAGRSFGVHRPVKMPRVGEGELDSSAFSALALLGAMAKPLVS